MKLDFRDEHFVRGRKRTIRYGIIILISVLITGVVSLAYAYLQVPHLFNPISLANMIDTGEITTQSLKTLAVGASSFLLLSLIGWLFILILILHFLANTEKRYHNIINKLLEKNSDETNI